MTKDARRLQAEVVLCRQCGKVIDQAKVSKGGKKRRPQFCNHRCSDAHRKAQGFYGRLAQLGNEAQAAVKAVTGHAPKYEERSRAVATSNREKPRRRQRKDKD